MQRSARMVDGGTAHLVRVRARVRARVRVTELRSGDGVGRRAGKSWADG